LIQQLQRHGETAGWLVVIQKFIKKAGGVKNTNELVKNTKNVGKKYHT